MIQLQIASSVDSIFPDEGFADELCAGSFTEFLPHFRERYPISRVPVSWLMDLSLSLSLLCPFDRSRSVERFRKSAANSSIPVNRAEIAGRAKSIIARHSRGTYCGNRYLIIGRDTPHANHRGNHLAFRSLWGLAITSRSCFFNVKGFRVSQVLSRL